MSIRKNFYQEHPSVTNRSEVENTQLLKDKQIKTSGGSNCPRPIKTFRESGLPKELYEVLENTPNYKEPTHIQAQCWPVALSGMDLVGIAQTGSGKTLSFILPALIHVADQEKVQPGEGPIVIVMAPTRELAMQIQQEAAKFAQILKLKTLCVYGGQPKYMQEGPLSKGVEILIATPGRLLDFLDSGNTNLKRITYLVLDEADRMLDMGFEKDIRRIIEQTDGSDRQTMMFSATWPKEIQDLASTFCNQNPVHIQVGDLEGHDGQTVNKDIKQVMHFMESNYEKQQNFNNLLISLIRNQPMKILVFSQTKRGVDELERSMNGDRDLQRQINYECRGIHGDKKQYQRDEIYRKFKFPMDDCSVKSNILIATDVASRGLDVKDINVVINYDMPSNLDDYIHRIGRTGRANKKGVAHSLLTSNDLGLAPQLVKLMRKTNQEIPQQLFELRQNQFDKIGQKRSYGSYNKYNGGGAGAGAGQPMPTSGGGYGSSGGYSTGANSNSYNGGGGYGGGSYTNKRDQKYNDKQETNDISGGNWNDSGSNWGASNQTKNEPSSGGNWGSGNW